MGMRLKVTSGPLMGREYNIRSGDVIGRSQVEIQVSDPKISGRHAKFELLPSGKWVLIDLGSKGGLRVGDQTLLKLPLEAGTQFQLGKTDFVILADLSEEPTAPPQLPNQPSKSTPFVGKASTDPVSTAPVLKQVVPAPVEKPTDQVLWNEYLAHFATRAHDKIIDTPQELLPFDELVVLKFISGVQQGTEWTLGYGPRQVGLSSLDLPLFEEDLPPIAFTLTPQNGSVQFSTEHSSKIKLNGRAISSEMLSRGDIITAGNTKISVSFKE